MQLWPTPPVAPPETEAADVQCPRCGTYGPTVTPLWRNTATGELFHTAPALSLTRVLAIWLTLSILLAVVTNALLGPASFLLAVLLAGTLAVGYMGIYNWQIVRRQANADRAYSYKCRRCLHEWVWVTGHSVPRYQETRQLWEDFRSTLNDPNDNPPPPN